MAAQTGARRLRIMLLGLLMGLQIVTLALATLAWRSSSEKVLRRRLDADLELATNHAAQQVATHLANAGRLRDLLLRVVPSLGERDDDALEAMFLAALQTTPEANGLFIGRHDGSFLFVTRQDRQVLSKRIVVTPTRSVRLTARATFDAPPIVSADSTDTYDPRTRPWFRAATQHDSATWTDVYQFATSGQSGITTAAVVAGTHAAPSVVGVDVRLSELNRFIDTIRISTHATTMLLDAHGTLLGSQSVNELPLAARRDDPQVENALAVHPQTRTESVRHFSFQGREHAAVLAPVRGSPGWLVAVATPESDFLSEQREIRNRLLRAALGATVAAAAIGAAVFMLLRRRVDGLADRASVDSLTGVLNRARTVELAERRVERNRRNARTTFLCMLDIDGFKRINDTYGHPEGDRALRTIAERLGTGLRAEDLFGRYGGEEFLLLFDRAGEHDAAVTAVDRLRRMATEEPMELGGELVSITISAGLACADPAKEGDGFGDLLLRADRALYDAKRGGRNRTVAHLPVQRPLGAAAHIRVTADPRNASRRTRGG